MVRPSSVKKQVDLPALPPEQVDLPALGLARNTACILDCPALNCTRGVELCYLRSSCVGVRPAGHWDLLGTGTYSALGGSPRLAQDGGHFSAGRYRHRRGARPLGRGAAALCEHELGRRGLRALGQQP